MKKKKKRLRITRQRWHFRYYKRRKFSRFMFFRYKFLRRQFKRLRIYNKNFKLLFRSNRILASSLKESFFSTKMTNIVIKPYFNFFNNNNKNLVMFYISNNYKFFSNINMFKRIKFQTKLKDVLFFKKQNYLQLKDLKYLRKWRRIFKNYYFSYYNGTGIVDFVFSNTIKHNKAPFLYVTGLMNPLINFLFSSKSVVYSISKPFETFTLLEVSYLQMSVSAVRRTSRLFTLLFVAREFIELVYYTIKLKDFDIILSYVQRLISRLIVWDQKKLFVFFFGLYREHINPILPLLKIYGLQIRLSGKIGVGGNSRKRRMRLNLGKVTNTNRYTNLSNFSKIVKTKTGALGLQISLFY